MPNLEWRDETRSDREVGVSREEGATDVAPSLNRAVRLGRFCNLPYPEGLESDHLGNRDQSEHDGEQIEDDTEASGSLDPYEPLLGCRRRDASSLNRDSRPDVQDASRRGGGPPAGAARAVQPDRGAVPARVGARSGVAATDEIV